MRGMNAAESGPEVKSLGDALPERKRGRPRAAWFTAAEVAAWLDVDEAIVARSLSGKKFRKALWPHAEEREGVWVIPERDLARILGPGIPRPLWVADFAELIGYSVPQVNFWISAGVIPFVMIFGKRRVLETVVWQLPKYQPATGRKCPRLPKKAA